MVNQYEAGIQESNIGLWFMSEESGSPNPWASRVPLFGNDDDGWNVVVFEIESVEAMER